MKVLTPQDWEQKRLRDVCKMYSGSTPSRNDARNFSGKNMWVSSGELKEKYIYSSKEFISDKAIADTALSVMPPGTVIIAIYGLEASGIRGTASIAAVPCTISQACMGFYDFDNSVCNEYFYYWYIFNGQNIGRRYAQGTKQQNLSSEILSSFPICLPPMAEQRKIAAILSAQDRVIELKTRLLGEKKRLKKYLCQLIMGGNKIKLARGYSVRLLSSITKKKLIKNKDLKYSVVLSNSAKYGIVPQNVQFDKNIANEENIDRYYVAEIGDFIYNPRISTSAPCGPINQNDCCDGVVSPLYTVFSCSAECVCDKYLKYYFQTSLWHEYIQSVANTGARYDRMNVSDKDFFSMAINLPPLNTQRQCVVLLDAFSNVIKLMEENLEQEKLKKKALMQQLLTGKVRVTGKEL